MRSSGVVRSRFFVFFFFEIGIHRIDRDDYSTLTKYVESLALSLCFRGPFFYFYATNSRVTPLNTGGTVADNLLPLCKAFFNIIFFRTILRVNRNEKSRSTTCAG